MSVPAGVMAISAYQSARGTLINSGIRLPHQDNLHGVGGEGPAGNGALKPDLLAPANPISLEAGYPRDIEGAIWPYAFDNLDSVSVTMGMQMIELK